MTIVELVESSPINSRVADGKEQSYFVAEYKYKVDGLTYIHSEEHFFVNQFEAENNKRFIADDDSIELWYDRVNPDNSSLEDPSDDSLIYLFICTIFVLWMFYMSWLLVKYYDLEIA